MLAMRQGQRQIPANPVFVPMSRGEIADYLGLTTETVSRSFSQLKDSGHISVPSRGSVQIDNLGRLADGLY